MVTPSAFYRVWQFWQTLTGKLSQSNWDEIEQTLTPNEIKLFRRMSRADQTHAYRVLQALRGMEQTSAELLTAGLLHDVGKSLHPLRIWERPIPVLVPLFGGDASSLAGEHPPKGWRRPLVIATRHPAWGADLASTAGTSPLAVWLIRHHQDENPPPFDHPSAADFLKYLKQADNQN